MLQFRPTDEMGNGHGPMYAPNRDVAYFYPAILEGVEQRLLEGKGPELTKLLQDNKVSDDDLAKALNAYCHIFMNSTEDSKKSVHDVIKESGWLDCPFAARVVIHYHIAAAMTGLFFQATRDITKQGDSPYFYRKLLLVTARVSSFFNAGPLRRLFLRFRAKWLTSEKAICRRMEDE
jgi:hypothetical protein